MVQHLVIDLDGVRMSPLVSCYKTAIKDFITAICRNIGMKPLSDILLYQGSPHLPGWTAVQIIETSHIAVHQFYTKQIRIDIYSCKPFSSDTVVELTDLFFPSDLKRVQIIERWPIKGVIEAVSSE